MHHFIGDSVEFNFNSDFSGEIYINSKTKDFDFTPAFAFEIEGNDLISLMDKFDSINSSFFEWNTSEYIIKGKFDFTGNISFIHHETNEVFEFLAQDIKNFVAFHFYKDSLINQLESIHSDELIEFYRKIQSKMKLDIKVEYDNDYSHFPPRFNVYIQNEKHYGLSRYHLTEVEVFDYLDILRLNYLFASFSWFR